MQDIRHLQSKSQEQVSEQIELEEILRQPTFALKPLAAIGKPRRTSRMSKSNLRRGQESKYTPKLVYLSVDQSEIGRGELTV